MLSWMSEAFWIGFGFIATVLALLAGTRFLTKLLSTDEYGRLALAVSLTALAVQIFGDPIGKTAVRFYSHWCEAGKPYGFMQNIGRSLIYAVAGIVLCCSVAFISGYWVNGCPDFSFIMVTGFFAILLVLNRIAFALEDAARKRRFRGIIQGVFEVMRFFFAIALIILLSVPEAEIVLSGFVIAGVLVVIAHSVFLYAHLSSTRVESSGGSHLLPVSDTVSMQSFQFPLILSSACIWLVMMAERWILNHYGIPEDVGGYAAVYQLAFIPMLFISNFLILFIEPILYQVISLDGKTSSSLNLIRINHYAAMGILFVTFILFIVLLFYYPAVGYFFLGVEFRPYSWIFPWLVLSGGCFAATQQLLLKLSCQMRTDLLAVLWSGVAAIAVTAYIIGVSFWQLKGLIAAIVTINVSLVIFSLFYLNRLVSQK